MSIRQEIYCDICEFEHGEQSAESRINKPEGCPGYPQVTWTYFKLGLEIVDQPGKMPHLTHRWQGSVDRMEFCPDHAHQLNALLKAFMKEKDPRLMKILDELASEDAQNWADKQDAIAKQCADKQQKFKEEQDGTDGQ